MPSVMMFVMFVLLWARLSDLAKVGLTAMEGDAGSISVRWRERVDDVRVASSLAVNGVAAVNRGASNRATATSRKKC